MFTDLKPYSAYAKSSVSWLGARPLHWRLAPGMAVLLPVKAKNSNLAESTVLSLSYGRIVVKPSDRIHGLVPASFDTYQVLDSGNIVVRPTDLQNDQTSIRVGIVRDHGIITSAYLGFNVIGDVAPDFAYTYLAALDALKVFYGMGSGLRQNLELADFKRLPFLLPPADEQAAIVKYLGHANARIDRAIAAKRKLIALLEEQKQAIINHAVTRGLDPAVPLKDSGITWLGQIPAHWDVIPTSVGSSLIQTGPFGSQLHADEYIDGGVPVINPTHLATTGIAPDPAVSVNSDKADGLSRHRLVEGDVIAARRGELGRCVVVGHREVGWICGTGSLIVRLKRAILHPSYFQLLFSSRQTKAQLEAASIGATMANLNAQMVARLRIPKPPVDEQLAIVAKVRAETVTTADWIAVVDREIELLREFRTRLTADVVTGQLDVREAAARLPELDLAELVSDVGEQDEDDLDAELAESLEAVDA